MQSLAFFSLLTFTWSHGQVFLISFRVILCFCIFFTSFFTSLSFSLIQNIFSLDIVSLHGPLEKESLIHWIRVWGLLWTQQWSFFVRSCQARNVELSPKQRKMLLYFFFVWNYNFDRSFATKILSQKFIRTSDVASSCFDISRKRFGSRKIVFSHIRVSCKSEQNYYCLGQWFGSVGGAVASITRDPRFISRHNHFLLSTVLKLCWPNIKIYTYLLTNFFAYSNCSLTLEGFELGLFKAFALTSRPPNHLFLDFYLDFFLLIQHHLLLAILNL